MTINQSRWLMVAAAAAPASASAVSSAPIPANRRAIAAGRSAGERPGNDPVEVLGQRIDDGDRNDLRKFVRVALANRPG